MTRDPGADVRSLASGRDLALDVARDVDRELDLAGMDTRALARDVDREFDLAHAHGLARAFADDLAHALAYVLTSLVPIAIIDETGVDSDTASPSRGCRRLMALVVRVLPAGQRARYAEEFLTDMGELPRDKQLAYCLRLLVRSWALRGVLLDTRDNARVAGTGESKR